MRQLLESTALFSSSEIDYFLSHGEEKIVQKGEYFLKEGQVANKFAFIQLGILRSFYYSNNSEEVTYCFSFPGELIAGYSSFITQEPTRENIQAINKCLLLQFPKTLMDELIEANRNWLLFSKNIAENQYVKLENRIFILQKENARTKYKELIEKQTEYLQNIPLGYLASYLGVSQRHLSRLRKQIIF